jgi:hypothetical protein
MFNIKVSMIRERTTNGPTYMNGRTCYRNGQVSQATYDPDKGLIQATVDGTQPYQVCIILSRDGSVHDTSCTCSAFTSYWGDCKHIAAVLLYANDHFGEHPVSPAAPVSRKSRAKARDFLMQAHRRAQIVMNKDALPLRVHALLTCGSNPSTLPTLSLAISNGRLHPVSHIEQLVDALSRDLPIEIDDQLTYDPLVHRFDLSDEPLLQMLVDAYEQDYKSAFGSAASARSEKQFILNASRFAAFLRLAKDQPRYRWTLAKSQDSHPVQVLEQPLPLRVLLSESDDEEGHYVLQRQKGPLVSQLTASRNIFLVDDTFFLPPRDSIRLMDPILAAFASPGLNRLVISADEAADLAGLPETVLEAVCPIDFAPDVAGRMVREPLKARISFHSEHDGLSADVVFGYGQYQINPLAGGPLISRSGQAASDRLIVRQRASEQSFLDLLTTAGFRQQGQSFRLSELDALDRFLDYGLGKLENAGARLVDHRAQPYAVLPAPLLTVDLATDQEDPNLCINVDWSELGGEDRLAYVQALRDQKPYCQMRSGLFRRVDHEGTAPLLTLFDRLAAWGIKPTKDRLVLPRYRVLSLVSLSGPDEVANPATGPLPASEAPRIRFSPEILKMAGDLATPGQRAFRLPNGLTVPLRPYQKTGFNWLCTLDHYGLGGILADDMGLGKTLQAIAYIAYCYRHKRKPALVIAPTSLVYNWQREFEKFAPHLPVVVLDGNRQQRSARLESIRRQACVVTSYSLVRRDYPELAEISFSSCFLDEAQNIKNPETLNARSVKQIKAERTFALTGTPIENTLTELWSIFDFLLPGYLSTRKKFEAQYVIPAGKDQQPELLAKLHRQIEPFVLRRMKKDVLHELPDKIETRVICEMTEAQRELYQQFLGNARQSFEQEVQVNGFARSQLYILALLTRLRQICCHPALFLNDYQADSGKLLLLEELITDALASGHRLLVFSQFAQMLQIIRERLAHKGLDCFLIDGQVAADERLAQVDRFNAGEGQVFLISLRAGGTGLNLTGADTVIHYDPWWNPAVEDQATDRAYRIGQENIVQVFKLYARDTLEEKIQAIQEQKQALIEAVIKPGQNLLSQLTVDEVRSLFEP